jgi:hypothetical protein
MASTVQKLFLEVLAFDNDLFNQDQFITFLALCKPGLLRNMARFYLQFMPCVMEVEKSEQ